MGGGSIVFFSSAEIRVRIVEQPALNSSGADAYDLVDDVANALQGQPRVPGKLSLILSYPLQLAATPVDQPYDADLQDRYRILDVIFEAVYGFKTAALRITCDSTIITCDSTRVLCDAA